MPLKAARALLAALPEPRERVSALTGNDHYRMTNRHGPAAMKRRLTAG